ncbi:Crp/Fnr family transcriptional regulator [Flavobacterium notoginsengisoli]|uniref:Crp/Fnr family transcriptional regulator n=1 Tax=Flavobacterium notoginsengisoli TaxID=1478199 RepID=UPI00363684D3
MQEIVKQHINKIVQISHEEFEEIETFFYKEHYKKGSYLVEAGKLATYEFYITKGLVASSFLNEYGKNSILHFAAENQWISDIESFNTGAQTRINIKCLEDTEVYRISYQDKEKLCAVSKKMEYFFRKKSNDTCIMLQNRIMIFMYTNSKDRYDKFMALHPSIFLRVPKLLLASFLGVTERTLSVI